MARHRSPGGQDTSPALDKALNGAALRVRGAHRIPAPSSAVRGKVVVAAVAAGAFAAAAAGQTLKSGSDSSTKSHAGVTPLASSHDATAAMGVGGRSNAASAPTVLAASDTDNAASEVQELVENEQVTEARKKREAEAARKAAIEAARPKFVAPTQGRFSSGFGARWGGTHLGIDIANDIGTPIVAAADGTVIEAGPASGFGNWVRIQLDDGTVHVYGHISSYSVYEGQRVKAGEQIALMGNEGQSTGPHLHFEVWDASGRKIDPRGWLAAHDVAI